MVAEPPNPNPLPADPNPALVVVPPNPGPVEAVEEPNSGAGWPKEGAAEDVSVPNKFLDGPPCPNAVLVAGASSVPDNSPPITDGFVPVEL